MKIQEAEWVRIEWIDTDDLTEAQEIEWANYEHQQCKDEDDRIDANQN